MTNLKQKLMAVGMACLVSAGAFAQKDEKRPPKPPDKVVAEQKTPKEKPAQKNDQGEKRNDKKGKP